METIVEIQLIKSESDYNKVLTRIDEIIDAEEGTLEYEELDILSYLVEQYEEEHYQVEEADPITLLKVLMEERGFTQSDLSKVIGSKGVTSELLNYKRKLNLNHIRKIQTKWNIPAVLLIDDYELNN